MAAARGAFGILSRWGADFRLAALERRLRQDPGDFGRRAAVAAFHCKQAVSAASRPAIGCSGSFQSREAIASLESASHHLDLLLDSTKDIHRLYHVISHAVGGRLFYQLPEVTAKYMRKIGLDRECLEEFDTKSEFEERATPYHLANALAVLKAAGRRGAAEALFAEALELRWKGQRPIAWTQLEQTPAVYISGLEHRPFWDATAMPLSKVLEAHWHEIVTDVENLRKMYGRAASVPAYPNLVEGAGNGVWDMLQLYSNRKWHDESCALAPRTSKLLKRYLPSADVPYVHYNTEEVVFFLLAPGSRVRLHNGGSNVPINLHLGISGCDGAYIDVAGETRALRDGFVVAFDDGSDHRVWHDGPGERWVLTVRQMHPDLAANPAPYFSRAFTHSTSFESWDAARQARLCGIPRSD